MAQEKARLQERKKLLLEEIQFSNKVLEQTKKEKDVSFHQLKTQFRRQSFCMAVSQQFVFFCLHTIVQFY